jgi:hypothetical protein
MRTYAILLSALFAASIPLPARAWDRADDGALVRCESNDGRTRECATDARGGARLLRQLSRSACVEGETWGRTRRAIWVTGGCRGEFLVRGGYGRHGRDDGDPQAHGGHFRCESDKGRWNHCAVPTRRGVEFVRQLSRSACIRGQSWGMDARGVWVNGGCRAEFRLGGARGDAPAASRFRCESSDGRPQFCRQHERGDVRLIRQLSRSPCVEGRTWGREADGVWVEQGCRAEFEVAVRWARY